MFHFEFYCLKSRRVYLSPHATATSLNRTGHVTKGMLAKTNGVRDPPQQPAVSPTFMAKQTLMEWVSYSAHPPFHQPPTCVESEVLQVLHKYISMNQTNNQLAMCSLFTLILSR